MRPLLELVSGAGILRPDSIVIAEHFKKQPSPEKAGGLSLVREAKYGDTVLAFYTVKETP
jgi:16S rRNA G966 N2-methylase RsmD